MSERPGDATGAAPAGTAAVEMPAGPAAAALSPPRHRRPLRLRLGEAWHRWSPATPRDVRCALGVEGLVAPSEVRLLWELGRSASGGAIVEIGSFRGRSTVALALGARAGGGAAVVAVDPHAAAVGVLGGVFSPADGDAFRANVARTGVAAGVRHIARPSLDAAAAWAGPIAVLWIDGDHRPAAVRADVAAWAPFVTGTGRLALHDARHPALGPAIVALELVASGRWRVVHRAADTVVLGRAAPSPPP